MPAPAYKIELMNKGLKVCQGCKETLPLDRFTINLYGDLISKCKECFAAYSITYSRIRNERLKLERQNKVKEVIIKIPKKKPGRKPTLPATELDVRTCTKCGIEKNLMTGYYKKHGGSKNIYYEHKCRRCVSDEKAIKWAIEHKDVVRKPRVYKDKLKKVKDKLKKVKVIDYSIPMKKKVLIDPNYIDNKTLHCEMMVSLAQGKLTKTAADMIMLICYKLIRRFRYSNIEDREDCLQYAYLNIFRMWMNYNPDVTHNAFAYFTELSKRALAMQWKRLTRGKGMIDGEYYHHLSLDTTFDGKNMNSYI